LPHYLNGNRGTALAAWLEKNRTRGVDRAAARSTTSRHESTPDHPCEGENAMQYLLLCCFDEMRWAQMPDAQKDQIMQEYDAFIQSIVKSGHFRASTKLQPTSMATTVREQHGQRITTDGPFAETKEQVGGYHLIECQDLDEALAIARRIPTLCVGGAIEVRPVVPPSER
jgi:hypothetical protein